MAARDRFHKAVKNALVQDGWTITDDPLAISFGGVDLYIDLGAERLIAAERDDERIAVEVKSFLGASLISEFHTALGQFMSYHLALQFEEPDRILYLAVPVDTYEAFFKLEFAQLAIQNYQVKLLVFEPNEEVIVRWIS